VQVTLLDRRTAKFLGHLNDFDHKITAKFDKNGQPQLFALGTGGTSRSNKKHVIDTELDLSDLENDS
jgi:hypothetical protein